MQGGCVQQLGCASQWLDWHTRRLLPSVAGDYPLHPDPEQNRGISQWVAQDRNLNGADCVLWYTLGLTHVVRCEVRAVVAAEAQAMCPWARAVFALSSATCTVQLGMLHSSGSIAAAPAGLASDAGGGAQLPPQALGLLHPGGAGKLDKQRLQGECHSRAGQQQA